MTRWLATIVVGIGAAMAASQAIAEDNDTRPVATKKWQLLLDGNVCVEQSPTQSICTKGGSVYICPDNDTCVRAARKQPASRLYKAPGNNLLLKAP